VQCGYKEELSCEELLEFRDTSLSGYDLGNRGIKASRVFGDGICRIMSRQKLRREEKTLCAI
jgi:hypothetical protein